MDERQQLLRDIAGIAGSIRRHNVAQAKRSLGGFKKKRGGSSAAPHFGAGRGGGRGGGGYFRGAQFRPGQNRILNRNKILNRPPNLDATGALEAKNEEETAAASAAADDAIETSKESGDSKGTEDGGMPSAAELRGRLRDTLERRKAWQAEERRRLESASQDPQQQQQLQKQQHGLKSGGEGAVPPPVRRRSSTAAAVRHPPARRQFRGPGGRYSTQPQVQTKKICRDFAETGSCSRAGCRFVHLRQEDDAGASAVFSDHRPEPAAHRRARALVPGRPSSRKYVASSLLAQKPASMSGSGEESLPGGSTSSGGVKARYFDVLDPVSDHGEVADESSGSDDEEDFVPL